LSQEDEEIKRIKAQGEFSNDSETIKRSIDALADYGTKAIPDILDVIDSSLHSEIEIYGLAVIERLRKYSSNL
jgi:hypothetical protein